MTSFMQASRPKVLWRRMVRALAAVPKVCARAMTSAQVPAKTSIMGRSKRFTSPLASREPTRPPQHRYSANSSSSWVSFRSILSRSRWQNSTGQGGMSLRKRMKAKSSAQDR